MKTTAALGIAALGESLKDKRFKVVSYATALGIVLNNAVELFRLVPRYKAGLQGSLEMAKDRWKSIEETGIDPFNQQAREINDHSAQKAHFTQKISPATLAEQAEKTSTNALSR